MQLFLSEVTIEGFMVLRNTGENISRIFYY